MVEALRKLLGARTLVAGAAAAAAVDEPEAEGKVGEEEEVVAVLPGPRKRTAPALRGHPDSARRRAAAAAPPERSELVMEFAALGEAKQQELLEAMEAELRRAKREHAERAEALADLYMRHAAAVGGSTGAGDGGEDRAAVAARCAALSAAEQARERAKLESELCGHARAERLVALALELRWLGHSGEF